MALPVKGLMKRTVTARGFPQNKALNLLLSEGKGLRRAPKQQAGCILAARIDKQILQASLFKSITPYAPFLSPLVAANARDRKMLISLSHFEGM